VEGSPAIVSTGQYGHTANMERIMRAQTFASGDNINQMKAQKTLELNPRHPIISALLAKVDSAPDAQETKDLANHVFDTALFASGFAQEDVEEYTERMYRTIASTLQVESMDLEEEIEIPEEEEVEEPAAPADEESGPGDDEF